MKDNFVTETYEMIDILPSLTRKYVKFMRSDITKVMLLQNKIDIILEITSKIKLSNGLEKIKVSRENLSYFSDVEGENEILFFNPIDDIEVNADKFVNVLGAYSISMTLDLFDFEASKEIDKNIKE